MWDTAIRENARKYEGFANYFASPGTLPKGRAVTEYMKKLGYEPKDIDYCILTHMDYNRIIKRRHQKMDFTLKLI